MSIGVNTWEYGWWQGILTVNVAANAGTKRTHFGAHISYSIIRTFDYLPSILHTFGRSISTISRTKSLYIDIDYTGFAFTFINPINTSIKVIDRMLLVLFR